MNNNLSENQVFNEIQKLLLNKKYIDLFCLSKTYAEKGYVDAQKTLGYLYMHGLGTPKDFSESEYWLLKSKNSGSREAIYHLGALSMHRGDNTAALSLFLNAADLGYVPAICRAGLFYKNGIATKKDTKLAYDYLSRAAKLGNYRAKKDLALILLAGYKGWTGRIKSFSLFFKALSSGLYEAYKNPNSINFRF